jgi:hypothetical protein
MPETNEVVTIRSRRHGRAFRKTGLRPWRTAKAAALRQKRHRRLVRDGLAVAPVCYSADVVEMLVRLHWLREADAGDRRKIGDAITRMLADTAKRK